MAETKRYLDAKGLSKFWSEVRKYYSADSSAVVDNATKLANERVVKLEGDVTGKASFDGSSNAVINAKVDIAEIESHDIVKMFGEEVTVSTPAELVSTLTDPDLESGTVVTISEDMQLPSRVEVVGQKDVTINVPSGVEVTLPESERFLSVKTGSTVELVGDGVVKMYADAAGQPLAFCYGYKTSDAEQNECNLIIDGVTLEMVPPSEEVMDWGYTICTNGNYYGANITIKSGTFKGDCYFPGAGKVTIEGGEFISSEGPCICIKGSDVSISGGTFKSTSAGRMEGNWAHWNNGYIRTGGAVVVEACNYGGKGNPKVSITGGEFIVEGRPADADWKDYGVLVIDYNGNSADMSGTTVSYQKAVVSGHVTSMSGNAFNAPSDGWYKFTDENTTSVVL